MKQGSFNSTVSRRRMGMGRTPPRHHTTLPPKSVQDGATAVPSMARLPAEALATERRINGLPEGSRFDHLNRLLAGTVMFFWNEPSFGESSATFCFDLVGKFQYTQFQNDFPLRVSCGGKRLIIRTRSGMVWAQGTERSACLYMVADLPSKLPALCESVPVGEILVEMNGENYRVTQARKFRGIYHPTEPAVAAVVAVPRTIPSPPPSEFTE